MTKRPSTPPKLPPVTQPTGEIREGSGMEILFIIPLCLLLYFLGDKILKRLDKNHEKIENVRK